MPNTSATGGILTPTPGPADGKEFRRVLQALFVGLSGIPGELVRPLWQRKPPPTPSVDVDWLAFGITSRRPDDNPYLKQNDDASTTLIRHEEIDVLCVFYGPKCEDLAGITSDGLSIRQNREGLFLAGIGSVGISEISHVPELVGREWYDRADMTLTMRREIRRDYPILSFVGVTGTTKGNRDESTLSSDWKVKK